MTTGAATRPVQPRAGTSRNKTDAANPSSASTTVPAMRRHQRPPTIDPLSDRATEALIRKVLLPQEAGDKGRDSQRPIDELLPPLTSRNDVDIQLYAFLAIILREFVQTWYNKITPDETFMVEIVHVIAHCTRALEQRIRHLDLENLLLNDVPEVLNRHITTYRSTHHNQPGPSIQVNAREAYHALWPLSFMSPVPITGDPITTAKQLKNEAAYRQLLVQAVLAVLLPTEDLQNPCLTALVGQIISELIIGNVIANKAAQPWLLYEAICIVGRIVTEKKVDIRQASSSSSDSKHRMNKSRKWTVQGFFVSIIQFVMLFISTVRLTFNLIMMSSSLPSRVAVTSEKTTKGPSQAQEHASKPTGVHSGKVAVFSFTAWGCLGNLIELPVRMPWLSGFLSLVQLGAIQGPGRVAKFDGVLDRLLSHRIQLFLSASHIPPVIRTLRASLFPNNAPGSSSLFPPSTDAEFQALRRRAAKALWTMLPASVGRLYFGGGMWAAMGHADSGQVEAVLDELESLVAVLDDVYCNKHLMYSILELILVRLIPEIAESSVEDLLQERLG